MRSFAAEERSHLSRKMVNAGYLPSLTFIEARQADFLVRSRPDLHHKPVHLEETSVGPSHSESDLRTGLTYS